MKSNSTNSAATGRRYWRSLDELADTPEFKDWLHREFPVGRERDGGRRHEPPAFPENHVRIVCTRGRGDARRGLPSAGRTSRTVWQAAGELYFWRGAVFCDRHAHAHRRDPAGRQILRRPAGQNRRQRAVPRRQRRHRPLRAGFDLDLYDPDRARHFKHDGKMVSRDEA